MLLASAIGAACSDAPPPRPPNVLWIVWDTVRADRLGPYGYDKPTTPFLDEWSRGARVFDDCISAGSWTVPSHASMFTGLLPSEHGAGHETERLADELDTVAELLQRAGYQTFCWTANPHVSTLENATQGFEVESHPWDEATRARAKEIFLRKLESFPAGSEVRRRGESEKDNAWVLKAAGEIGQEQLVEWLDGRDRERPYFAFLNYMEAHRPLLSPPEFRAPFMAPDEVAASYEAEIDWPTTWSYCFGMGEIEPERLALLSKSYDAAIRELDALLGELLRALDAAGSLDDTVIVLTADHGEHLSEHHLLDHQYSLAQVLVRVPLIVHYPARFAPGRETRPVMSMDLFPTLLELAGVKPPAAGVGFARSLLAPAERRARVSEYTRAFPRPLASARKIAPEHDLSAFERPLLSVVDGRWKLVQAVGGAARLYDLEADPAEQRDVSAEHPAEAERLGKQLRGLLRTLRPVGESAASERTEEHERLLNMLGYGDAGNSDRAAAPDEPR